MTFGELAKGDHYCVPGSLTEWVVIDSPLRGEGPDSGTVWLTVAQVRDGWGQQKDEPSRRISAVAFVSVSVR